MDDGRPDPDSLLGWVRSQEERGGARLLVFLGYAPGVGKTWAMLENAQALRHRGRDVVAGCVVTHGRVETGRLLDGLEILPPRLQEHPPVRLEEFDLERALARRPEVLLLDELAHSNAPGGRHPKRWHDVLDLLDAGIEVHTTLNIQHVDSLVASVGRITGVRVRETVPDALLERADEIRLVDLPPDDLLQRLREGRVYVPEQARVALEQFFRRGNLLALRELALRRAAERVDQDVQAWRREWNVQTPWPTAERIVACVGPAPGSEQVVRAACRLAGRLGAPWLAVYADPEEGLPGREQERARLERHLELAEQLGGEVRRLAGDPAGDGLARFVQRHGATRVVLGKPGPTGRWIRPGASPLEGLLRSTPGIELHLVPPAEESPRGAERPRPADGRPPARWVDIRRLWRVPLLVGLATLAGVAGSRWLAPADVALLHLTAVLAGAVVAGRQGGLLAASLAVLAYNFFFVPPYHTLRIDSSRHLLTFAVLFLAGWLASDWVERLRLRAAAARRREERTAALAALSKDMAGVAEPEEAALRVAERAREALGSPARVWLADGEGRLAPPAGDPDEGERALVEWAFHHLRPAGAGTDTLPGQAARACPLPGQRGVRGVLVLLEGRSLPDDQEGRSFLDAWLRNAALLLDRAVLAGEARAARAAAQREELRSSLLSAVSHDLRTPLAVITAAATTLREGGARLDGPRQAEMLETVVAESSRMERMVGNLLDMMRLESGGLSPRLEWSAPEELVAGALSRLEARLHGRRLDLELPAELPLVQVDALLVEQVLWNLLDNALRYTPEGTPLEIRAWEEDGRLALSLRDHGPGLPVADPSIVFQKFWRGGDPPQGPRPGGVGLGMAIAQGVLQAHGGRLEVANHPGGGACFTLWLPVPPAPDPPPLAGEEPAAEDA